MNGDVAATQLAMLGELTANLHRVQNLEGLAQALSAGVRWVVECDQCWLIYRESQGVCLYPGAESLGPEGLENPWRMVFDRRAALSTGDLAREPWTFDSQSPRSSLASHLILPLMDEDDAIGILHLAARRVGAYPVVYPSVTALLQRAVEGVVHRLRTLQREHAARRAAEEATLIRDEVLAVVSHDLKNPLSTIQMTARLLKVALTAESVLDVKVALTRIQAVERASQRMLSLINDILDTAQLQSGVRLNLRLEFLELGGLVSRVVEEHQSRAKNPMLVLERWPDPVRLHADASRLERVLDNLIGNALKYSPAGGLTEVALTVEPGWALVRVRDEGIGIPEAELPHLFEPYFRASNVQALPGAGLGLHAVRRIVELHGGTIEVQSRLGKGSTFTLRLPLPTS